MTTEQAAGACSDDAALLAAFTSATLPQGEWTHRAHLRVAWLFATRYALDEAHLLLRVAIIRLNAAHGLTETTTRGYHDTMTRAWLRVLGRLAREVPTSTSSDFVDACAGHLDRDALLRHYTPERLASVEARARFVEPDRAPLERGGD
jgi:hypothetical protein